MLQDPVSLVLARYPLWIQPRAPAQRLGNAGGLSGARLWRFSAADGELVLRAWPRQGPTLANLELIHGWLREISGPGLVAIPVPLPASDGRTVQQVDGLLWEVAPWLPGHPVAERPPAAWQVESAFAALAELHLRLSRHEHQGVSPGLRRRVNELEELSKRGLDLMEAAFQGAPAAELSTMAQRWALLARAVIPRLLPSLRDAARLEITLQPCLRDARPEHFLFEARRLAGLVDFGAMGIETVAADLARLIGEWFPDDLSLLSLAIAAYRRCVRSRNRRSPCSACSRPLATC